MLDEGVARVVTGSLHGLHGLRVRVEVDLARGLPGFSMVGLPGTAVRESRERVGAALRHAGFRWPQARITVNLAPADVRKDGAAIDLALATGLLLASGQLRRPADGLLRRTLIVGELGLDGALRPARGVVALGLDAAALGADRVLVPAAQARELDCVPGLRRIDVAHLRELPAALGRLADAAVTAGSADGRWPPVPLPIAEWAEVKGQARAKRALAIAAAGAHHLLLCGPPGCGKSMLARCLPALLPPLPPADRLERLRIHSCAGLHVDVAQAAIPPLRSPHPTVSRAGLIGGGRPPRPGEVTLAHLGALLLDEAAEFGAEKLDLLREPLGTGEVALSRVGEAVRFPARFQLVATTNPWRSVAFLPFPHRGPQTPSEGLPGDPRDVWTTDKEETAGFGAPPDGPGRAAWGHTVHHHQLGKRKYGSGPPIPSSCSRLPAMRPTSATGYSGRAAARRAARSWPKPGRARKVTRRGPEYGSAMGDRRPAAAGHH